MNKELKVFKMNDCEWWVTDGTAEEINNWYNQNIEDNDISDVNLCDIDKEGMWYLTTDIKDIERLGDSDEIIGFEIVEGQHKRKVRFGDLTRKYDEIYKFISFRDALVKEPPYTKPYCIASTEW